MDNFLCFSASMIRLRASRSFSMGLTGTTAEWAEIRSSIGTPLPVLKDAMS